VIERKDDHNRETNYGKGGDSGSRPVDASFLLRVDSFAQGQASVESPQLSIFGAPGRVEIQWDGYGGPQKFLIGWLGRPRDKAKEPFLAREPKVKNPVKERDK